MGETGNTPQETRIVKAIERSRIAVCFVAMFLGHSDYFRTFAALTVFSLAGLTAVESFLPRTVNGTGHTGPSEFCATSI